MQPLELPQTQTLEKLGGTLEKNISIIQVHYKYKGVQTTCLSLDAEVIPCFLKLLFQLPFFGRFLPRRSQGGFDDFQDGG